MKELKDHSGLDWSSWFWVDKEEYGGVWKTGRCRYRIEKSVGRDNEGRQILMVWVNLDKYDPHKFRQTFYEISFDEYLVFLDRAIEQGEVKPNERHHFIDKANSPFIPPWDASKDIVVYRDGRYTLGQKNERPYLFADGEEYALTCHPYEPCLYITDKNGNMTAVHNAFDPFDVLECFHRGDILTSITGFEYDAADFCRMAEYAAGMMDISISEAEAVFGDRPKNKRRKAPGTEKTSSPDNHADETGAKDAAGSHGPDRTPDDPFYELIARYPDSVVDYCIVSSEDDTGRNAHWMALVWACRKLFIDEDGETLWNFDVSKADAKKISADELFSREKKKGELTYRTAFLDPPHKNRYTGADFEKVNAALFPRGTDGIEVYKWTTDWSDYFDDGHEWWGTLCLTVYDKALDRFAVIMASATD